jgi:hypothetical protein
MNRLSFISVLVVALSVFSASCSSDDGPTSPGSDNVIQFRATLLPANEVPPVTNSESVGSGSANIDFFLTRDSAGAITGGTVNFTVTATGFPSTTAITAAHIHPGAAGVNGSVLVNATVAPGEVVLVGGAQTFYRAAIAISAANAQAIINNPPGFYFNVHTSANPGGVMRGQLAKI